MTRRLLPNAVVLAVVLAGVPALSAVANAGQPERQTPARGAVDLRPRFETGQVTRYEMQVNSKSQLTSKEAEELNQKQLMKQVLRLSLKVVEAGSDGATLELVYDAAKISFENEEFKAEYDSAKPPPAGKGPADPLDMVNPEKLLETLVKGMVGSKMTLKTDAAGNVVSVTGDGGVSSMSKSFMAAAGGGGGGIPGMPAGGMPAPGETAKWLINGPRPSGTANVGESWTNDDSLGETPLGDFRMKTTHTLVSHRGGMASLKFTGRAESASAGTPSQSGFQLLGMSNDGTYEWDTEKGSLAKMDSDMKVGIEANLTGMNMKQESTTTVSVKRLDR